MRACPRISFAVRHYGVVLHPSRYRDQIFTLLFRHRTNIMKLQFANDFLWHNTDLRPHFEISIKRILDNCATSKRTLVHFKNATNVSPRHASSYQTRQTSTEATNTFTLVLTSHIVVGATICSNTCTHAWNKLWGTPKGDTGKLTDCKHCHEMLSEVHQDCRILWGVDAT